MRSICRLDRFMGVWCIVLSSVFWFCIQPTFPVYAETSAGHSGSPSKTPLHKGENSQSEKNVPKKFVFVSPLTRGILSINAEHGVIEAEIRLKPSTIPDKNSLPLQISVEPAGIEAEIADQKLPGYIFAPKGAEAYTISARSRSGATVGRDKLKDTFTLGLGYPQRIGPEAAKNLRLFVLSGDRWLPVKSRLDKSRQMVVTQEAKQFGTYRLLAPAAIQHQDIIAYPNPIQFGSFAGVDRAVKFLNVPLGAVIEIYTITGDKIREMEAKTTEISWDGKKENGDLVTSGLYLYRVQIPGREAFGKIAVLR